MAMSRHDGVLSQSPPATATCINGGGEDLISLLPDCVLGEIVTLLPTDDAIRIQTLSSRWRHIWRSSPLNLDLDDVPHCCADIHYVLDILDAHPGPTRRLKLGRRESSDAEDDSDSWLTSPTLDGLQVLEILPGYMDWYDPEPLPPPVLRFAPTMRILKIGSVAFPSTAAALRFPHLELISFCRVEISESDLHILLAAAGCPRLRSLVLDECTGFANVRINSATMVGIAISVVTTAISPGEVAMRQVTIGDAPRLEELITFRHWVTSQSFHLNVISAPKLRVLGSVSKTISKLELGNTVFEEISYRVNHVERETVTREKRSDVHTTSLVTVLKSVKVLALEDVVSIGVLHDFLTCFPCLTKLYVSVSGEFRYVGSHNKPNRIECLEHHLKKVVVNGYQGTRREIKLAKFFVTKACVLELMIFRSSRDYDNQFSSKEWIADQEKQLQVKNRASQHVKFRFLRVANRYHPDVYCGEYISDFSDLIHDSLIDDPFHQWFELEETLAC